MKKIIEAHNIVLNILGKAKRRNSGYRMMKYCISKETEDGILLFNVLTRELLLLSEEEYEGKLESEYLKERWFIVPEEVNEKDYVEMVSWVLASKRSNFEFITNYTILTTTDCNARCFYCFERGRSRIPMSAETACKVADFIKKHHGGKKVNISWFGGEPLMNYQVIDLISEKLCEENIPYSSVITTNGYLFDDKLIEKATKKWNTGSVQITLDGTEQVYNRIKAYVNIEESAYQMVMNNINKLLDAGIFVAIRLNMDLHNAEDLFQLADELISRFADQSNLKVYPYLLIDEHRSWDERHTQEESKVLYEKFSKLQDKFQANGMGRSNLYRVKRKFAVNHCKVDDGKTVLITPDGHLGLCEHYTESEFFGHLDSEDWDYDMIESWRQKREELPECADCVAYPECKVPKKCQGRQKCSAYERSDIQRRIEQTILNEFHYWKNQIVLKEQENCSVCNTTGD